MVCRCGRAITLHDDMYSPTYVVVDQCPYHKVNYSQEAFIFQQYGHYKNQHLPMDLLEIPCWWMEGFLALNRCEHIDIDNRERNKNG